MRLFSPPKVLIPELILSLTLLISCREGGHVFDMVRKGDTITPGTIAVIAGKCEDQDYQLAKKLTEQINKIQAYRVMSQDQLSEELPNYPYQNIIGEWGNHPKNGGNPAWFSSENKELVRRAQIRIKSKYVFVVWTERMAVSNSYSIVAYGRLLAYPENRVIGYTEARFKKGGGCMVLTPHNQMFDYLIAETAGLIAKRLEEHSAIKKNKFKEKRKI